RRRLAVQAEACRKRRLEARQPFFSLERFEQRGFLAADIRAVAVMVVQVKGKSAAEDVVAEKSRRVRLLERLLATLVGIPDLAVNVVVAALAAHRVRGNRHPLNQ